MKRAKFAISAIMLCLMVSIFSCDNSDTRPDYTFNIDQLPSDSGGDDDEDPIIIGDTVVVD